MKEFTAPRMSMIRLSNEDVVCASGGCDSKMCTGFDCPDCPTICEGVYHCDVFKCTTY